MAHEYSVKDVAFQAGLSVATVDRVLNNRPNVRHQTRLRVEAAIEELRHQDDAKHALAQNFTLDVVMEAPDRFTDEVRHAFELEGTAFYPTTFRARFHFSEQTGSRDLVPLLDRIRNRKSHGVVLKAPDRPDIREAVARLHASGIPVVTLVTDLPGTERLSYAGIDNVAAGGTAAYLMAESLKLLSGTILLTLSSQSFHGEKERAAGFRSALEKESGKLKAVTVSEGYGRDSSTGSLVLQALKAHPTIIGVYSIGGGNRAILKAFETTRRLCHCFVAHDLDSDNLALLREKRLHFVLHHDLKADVRSIFQSIRSFWQPQRRVAPISEPTIQIITPYNIPVQRQGHEMT